MIVESTKAQIKNECPNIAKPMLGEDYGLKFHLLRLIEDDKLIHINSYFEGRNCEDVVFEEKENRLKKLVFANTQLEIDCAIGNYNSQTNKPMYLYIWTNIKDLETIKQYIE